MYKMKNILKFMFVFMLVVSCEDDLDINTNPNVPQDVEKRYVLSAAEGSLATVLGGTLRNFGRLMAQYHTPSPSASQYLDIDTYNITRGYADRMLTEL